MWHTSNVYFCVYINFVENPIVAGLVAPNGRIRFNLCSCPSEDG